MLQSLQNLQNVSFGFCLRRLSIYNEENKYAVIKVKVYGYFDLVTVVGKFNLLYDIIKAINKGNSMMNGLLIFVLLFQFLETNGMRNEKHVKFVGIENMEPNVLIVKRNPISSKKKRHILIPSEAELKNNDIGYQFISSDNKKSNVSMDIVKENRLIFWGNVDLYDIANIEFTKMLDSHKNENDMSIYDDLIRSYRGNKDAARYLKNQEKSQILREFWSHVLQLLMKRG